jgi:hypothetical protein
MLAAPARTAVIHRRMGNARRSGRPGARSRKTPGLAARLAEDGPSARDDSACPMSQTRVPDPTVAARYPSAASWAYAWVTTQREQPTSSASARDGGSVLPAGSLPERIASRSA